jgi:hypothetical protein
MAGEPHECVLQREGIAERFWMATGRARELGIRKALGATGTNATPGWY